MNKRVVSKIFLVTLLCSVLGYTVPVFAYTKDETVYTKLDSSGNNYKTIVSTHIENVQNDEIIKDLSDLLNIKNTSGDETYTQDGNTFVWNANKNDIYYQGESSKELPIECKVKYELDGKEISSEEIAGKSGKVKIVLQYINKEERWINVNGKLVKMYVPFVVVAGTIFNNEDYRNVEVSSGKIINDGTKTIVIGMAMPGLQESLGLSDDDVEIPSNIEITMDATDFESGSIMSYITPKVLEDEDLDIFKNKDKIYKQVDTLQSSSKKIEQGANDLKDGTEILSNGATQLKSGAISAYDGASQISSKVSDSIKFLSSDKSNALDNKTLKSIESQASEASKLTDDQIKLIIAEADKGIEEKADSIKNQSIASAKQIAESTAIQTALTVAQTTAKQTAIQTALTVAKTTAKQTAMQTAKSLNPNLTKEQLEIIGNQAGSNANLSEENLKTIGEQAAKKTELSEEQKKQIIANADKGVEAQRTVVENQAIASAKQIAEQTAISAAQKGATTAAKATATTVATSVANEVKSTASKSVVSQMKVLENGLNQLTSGLSTLNNGVQSLEDGAIELQNGATTLSNGIKTFNEEGINKICNFIKGNAKNLSDRIEKLTELSKEYNNFTMLEDGNQGNVKFIMIIDAVKKQEEIEQGKEKTILSTNIDNDEEK